MADSKISALPAAAGPVGDTDIFPGDPAAAAPTSKFTALQLKTYTSLSPALVTPDLGTPTAGVGTNLTGTASGLTAGIALGLKSASTTVVVSAATAPTSGQVLTATSGTAANWQTVTGTGTVTHTGALTANAVVLGNGTDDIKPMGSLGTTTTVLHGNAAGAPTFAAVNLATDVTGVIPTVINAQTGTTYTVVAGDQGKLVTFSNGAAVAVTLPQATGSFTTGWSCAFLNLGAGIVTITPTTSTWNGAATVKLRTGQGGVPVSDGTNYQGPVYQTANALTSATTIVDTSAATAPTNGQVLTATSGTAATWQTPSGGGSATAGSILGFNPTWTSATVLGAGSGTVYIESLAATITGAPADITPSSPSNNTWYHIYVFSTAGTPTLEASTAAPIPFATPAGFARSKTGDTSRRYIYSARTDGSGNFYRFVCNQRGDFKWHGPDTSAAPFRVLTNGAATSSTSIDCSAVVPVTAQSAYIFPENLGQASQIVYVVSGDLTASSTLFDTQCNAPPTAAVGGVASFYAYTPCSSTQTLNYITSASGGSFYLDVAGWQLQR